MFFLSQKQGKHALVDEGKLSFTHKEQQKSGQKGRVAQTLIKELSRKTKTTTTQKDKSKKEEHGTHRTVFVKLSSSLQSNIKLERKMNQTNQTSCKHETGVYVDAAKQQEKCHRRGLLSALQPIKTAK